METSWNMMLCSVMHFFEQSQQDTTYHLSKILRIKKNGTCYNQMYLHFVRKTSHKRLN
jgi:hypothetical protein